MIANKIISRIFSALLTFAFMLALTLSALGDTAAYAAGIRYATPDGTGDCSSWANACPLQTALTGASSGDEIWVAAGIYRPAVGWSDASFQLSSDVALYGGFAGTETTRGQRNPATHITILSGDVDNNDSQTPIISDLTTVTGNTTNSYHVVTAENATGAILDGFTITAGYADQRSYIDLSDQGGGMLNKGSNPTLTNITFSGNWASFGGGMSTDSSSNPTLTNVTFKGNSAASTGGGMFNDANGNSSNSPTLINVTFSSNSAHYNGGGMANYRDSNPIMKNVTFNGNSSGKGGGMYNNGSSSPTLTNVTFSHNSAVWGGGMYNYVNSSPTLTNVTFNGDLADYGGGMYNNSVSNPRIRNTIFWENTAWQIVNTALSAAILSDNVVKDGCPAGSTCTHTITTDPVLGALGDYGDLTQTIPLLPGSSAIDTGNDATCAASDQRGMARPQGMYCDIGAFEAVMTPPSVIPIIYLPLLFK